VLVVDNKYVTGCNWPITRSDAVSNTYQRRTINDGTVHEVLKNFPSSAEVVAAITSAGSRDVQYCELTYFWYASYPVASNVAWRLTSRQRGVQQKRLRSNAPASGGSINAPRKDLLSRDTGE
jgi:hypothetical protein